MNILYIEDNLLNAKVFQSLINSRWNTSIDIAETGELGVEKARTGDYEIIFMDINLPGISGIEATKQISALDECKDTPIIAVSADASAETQKQAKDAGCIAYVTKPILLDRFAEITAEYLEPYAK